MLQATAGPHGKYGGHWHDMDMILVGEHELGGGAGITLEQGKTQFGIWSLLAAPLIMGNDLRNVSDAAKAILLNEEVIAVDQDSMGKMALRLTPKGDTEVWARELANGDLAVGLLNKNGGSGAGGVDNCKWKVLPGGYNESCGGRAGNIGCSRTITLEDAKKHCCGLGSECASVSVPTSGSGESCYKKNDNCGWKKNAAYQSLIKVEQGPPQPPPKGVNITATLELVGWHGGKTAKVRDLWAHTDLGVQSSLEAIVPPFGLALFRLSKP